VQPGQVVGIVGHTGAGKTTLMSLIARFMDPDSGRITLDGVDLRDYDLACLREQFSMVLQEPLLFTGTILENIRYGRLDAEREEITEAARAANAHDFIRALPKRYATKLGERGAQISGGERQRISVARAFLKDAPVLLLDEPTSSIDSRTEKQILKALRRLMEGRTTFMVAHRLSTIRDADVILVVSDGEIVERGSHEELLAREGHYREMWEVQLGQRTLEKLAEAVDRAGVGALAAARDGEVPVNGHTNGHVNGQANGNGHANGHAAPLVLTPTQSLARLRDLCEDVAAGKLSSAAAAREAGLSASWFRELRRRYEQEGEAGLLPRTHARPPRWPRRTRVEPRVEPELETVIEDLEELDEPAAVEAVLAAESAAEHGDQGEPGASRD
jgi:ABC-type multidrug transport system ATPase subunit